MHDVDDLSRILLQLRWSSLLSQSRLAELLAIIAALTTAVAYSFYSATQKRSTASCIVTFSTGGMVHA